MKGKIRSARKSAKLIKQVVGYLEARLLRVSKRISPRWAKSVVEARGRRRRLALKKKRLELFKD